MNFRLILAGFYLCAVAGGLTLHGSDRDGGTRLPNIVILYSDDAGYADFGFQPSCRDDLRNLTPQIDSIARDGARFSNAYMSGCVCSPSRAGMMTGRYQGRFGFDNNLPPGTKSGLDLKETFGAKRLRNMGYRTGLVGKWHLGYPDSYHPNHRGFDWFFGLLQGSRKYGPIQNVSPHRVILENQKPTPESGYVTDRFGDAAVRFVNENRDRPFFLFVSFTAPHGPLQPRKSDLQRIKHIENLRRQKYAGLIVSLDDNVGKILAAINKLGIDDHTIVLFTNDNGGQTRNGADNGNLKGSKGTLWEGGIRVPWAIRWPEKIKPNIVVDSPVISLDLLPTIYEAAGKKVDPEWQLDGRSFLPALSQTDAKKSLGPRSFFWRQHGANGNIAMRKGKWKLVHQRSDTKKPELFDLENDVGESRNLASENPALLAEMIRELKNWESQLQEPRWGPGAPTNKKKKKKL